MSRHTLILVALFAGCMSEDNRDWGEGDVEESDADTNTGVDTDSDTDVDSDTEADGDIADDTGSDDTGPPDADGDGVPADEDCDDTDAKIGAATSWYYDGDSDGYGDPSQGLTSCSQPAGYVADNRDCDDTDGEVNPAADELWGDGEDNNCDGDIDEDSAIEGSYTGTISISIVWVTGTCDHYYGPLTCNGSAEAEAYASSGSVIFDGSFSCTARGTNADCGDGSVASGTFSATSTGGLSLSGDVATTGGACSGYGYDRTGTTTGMISSDGVTLLFDLYTCALEDAGGSVTTMDGVLELAR